MRFELDLGLTDPLAADNDEVASAWLRRLADRLEAAA